MKKVSKVLLTLFLVNLFSAVLCAPSKNSELSEEEYVGIREYADEFRNTLNPDDDPCVDFGSHVCNNILRSNIHIKDIQLENSEMEDLIVRYLPKPGKRIEAEEKMNNFLQSCINMSDKYDIKKFLKNYNFPNTINGWPALDPSWVSEKFDFFGALVELKAVGIGGLIGSYFSRKDNIFYIYPEGSALFGEKEAQRIKNVFVKYNLDYPELILRDCAQFEEVSTNAIQGSQETLTITYKDLKEKISDVNWSKYLEIATGRKPDETSEVIIRNLDGIKNLISVVKDMDPKVIANYFFCRTVAVIDEINKFNDTCYQKVYVHFPLVISRLVVNNFYTERYEKLFLDIIRLAVEASKKSLGTFENVTTENLIEPIKAMLKKKFLISLKDDELNYLYRNVEISSSDYFKNNFELLRFHIQKKQQNSDNELEYETELLSYRTLCYLFTHPLYQTYNKPSGLLFYRIGASAAAEVLYSVARDQTYSNSARECANLLIGSSSQIMDYHITILKRTQIFLSLFDDWQNENKKLVEEEDSILKEFNLTSKKIVYTNLMQVVCEPKPNELSVKLMLAAFKNVAGFSEEYSCAAGAAMNPGDRCKTDFEQNSN